MKIFKSHLSLIPLFIMFNGCITYREAYYFSPFNGNTATYHTIPLQSDSIKTATYGSLLFGGGVVNDNEHDDIFFLRPSIYRSHSEENFQFYYGGNVSLGTYYVKKFDTVIDAFTRDRINAKIINEHTGGKFFGGFGLDAGINYAYTFRGRHEWRLGLEGSYQHEFGKYFDFRNNLHDSAATVIHRQPDFITYGLNTEFVFKTQNSSIGFKISVGTPMGKTYRKLYRARYEDERFPFIYVSPAFQFTNKKLTAFAQITMATKTLQGKAGVSYRISSKNKQHKKPYG